MGISSDLAGKTQLQAIESWARINRKDFLPLGLLINTDACDSRRLYSRGQENVYLAKCKLMPAPEETLTEYSQAVYRYDALFSRFEEDCAHWFYPKGGRTEFIGSEWRRFYMGKDLNLVINAAGDVSVTSARLFGSIYLGSVDVAEREGVSYCQGRELEVK